MGSDLLQESTNAHCLSIFIMLVEVQIFIKVPDIKRLVHIVSAFKPIITSGRDESD